MEKAILPLGKAREPDEGARNPMADSMSPHQDNVSSRKITFADDRRPTDLSEKTASQKSYKDVLSQPAPSLSHRQKLLWLQKRRTSGLWVQCDDCDQWRYLPDVLDSNELPNKWYCRMNPDSANADCAVPETPIRLREEEDLIHSAYSAGSVVWARMPGWPWWPAMVDDCPDTEQFYWLDGFSDIPTHYNVVFFDSTDVTRGWIAPNNLKPYKTNKAILKSVLKDKKYKNRLQLAITQADEAIQLPLEERLTKYSFIAKYKGNLNTPKKITTKDLIRHQKKIKRQFNVEFPIEVESDDDIDEPLQPKLPTKKRNVILLGTPKRDKKTRAQNSNNAIDDDANILTRNPDSMDIVDTTPVLASNREIAKKRIQDKSMDVEDPNKTPVSRTLKDKVKINMGKITEALQKDAPETVQTEPLSDFKQPNSMVAQVGSTTDTILATATESYDNDTSKTYVPEFSQVQTEMGTQEFEVRAATPNSDDFDF